MGTTEISIFELRLLNAVEVAKILNVSKSHVYYLMEVGQLPSVQIGKAKRVIPETLQRFIELNSEQPK